MPPVPPPDAAGTAQGAEEIPAEREQTIAELLERSRRHLQHLQALVEAEAKVGKATTTLLRESGNLARQISHLAQDEERHARDLARRYRDMPEAERVDQVVAWLVERPVPLRARALAAITSSMEQKR